MSVDMAEDAKLGKDNGSNDVTVKRSPFFQAAKRTYRVFYLPTLWKKWVSHDSFWLLLKLLVKGTIRKAIK